jgi:hypothetical protein
MVSRRIAAALVVTAMAAAACGGATTATTLPATLPPHERTDLAEMFDPLVAPLGYHLTRAALIDRSTYAVDPSGGHLAIYLAPNADIALDTFASDFLGLVQVFLPVVFERWPELHSFDVCQEPFNSEAETPPSLTIIDLTRETAALIDWAALDLAALIGLNEREGVSVWARMEVRDTATWSAAASS